MARCRPAWLWLLVWLGSWSCGVDARDLTDRIEREIGRGAREAFRYQYGFLEDPLLTGWVDRVGQRIAVQVPRQALPYVFTIIDTDMVNAIASPGGFIFITKGLLNQVRNDDELAAVIAHELGHASERHGWKQLQRELAWYAGGAILGPELDDLTGLGFALVHALTSLGYTRELEERADRFAMEWSYRAGYDPRALLSFFDWIKPAKEPPRWQVYLRTHPTTRDRIRTVSVYPWASTTSVAVVQHVADDLYTDLRLTAAAAKYRELAKLIPTDPHAPARLALIELRWGRLNRAREQLAIARGGSPGAPAVAAAERLLARTEADGLAVRPVPVKDESWEAALADLRRAAGAAAERQQLLSGEYEAFKAAMNQVQEDRTIATWLDRLRYVHSRGGDWKWTLALAQAQEVLLRLDRAKLRAEAARNAVRDGFGELRQSSDEAVRTAEQRSLSATDIEALAADLREVTGQVEDEWSRGLRLAQGSLGPLRAGIQAMQLALFGLGDPFYFEEDRLSSLTFAALETATFAARNHADRATHEVSEGYRATVAGRIRVEALRLRLVGLGRSPAECEVLAGVFALRFEHPVDLVRELTARFDRLDDLAWVLAVAGSRRESPDPTADRRGEQKWLAYAREQGVSRDAVRLVMAALRRHLGEALPP